MKQPRIFLNGKFLTSPEEAHVSVFDQGYNFGAGLYEVIRVKNGCPFYPEKHFERLKKGAKALGMPLPYGEKDLLNFFKHLVGKDPFEDGMFYLQASFKGVPYRTNKLQSDGPITFLISYQEVPPTPVEWLKSGIPLTKRKDERWGNCWIKSVNLLPNLIAMHEAKEKGFGEVLFYHRQVVLECAASNIFFTSGKEVITPIWSKKILGGITRSLIFDFLKKIGITVREERVKISKLGNFDGAFVSSTLKGILPVNRIDEVYYQDLEFPFFLHKEFENLSRKYFTELPNN